MVKGIVNEDDEPVVPITLILEDKLSKFMAVVDTGFNGYLSVPQNLLEKSGWYFLGYEEYEIATGERVKEKVYLGKVIFDKEKMDSYILTSKSKDILLGTKLLRNKTLNINFRSRKLKIN